MKGGAQAVGGPVMTPVVRTGTSGVRAPDGMQLTLFTPV